MKSAFITTIALLALATVAAAKPLTAFEDGREVHPSLLTLPSAVGGMISYQNCAECRYRTFRLAENARFYVDTQEVSYAELKRYIAAHSNAVVSVVNSLTENIVTRVSAR